MPRRDRYVIREVEPKDLDGLYRLSKHLNSVNFPHDRAALERRIRFSRKSFAGRIPQVSLGRYMFVMAHATSGRIAGTSTIFAKHGTPEHPHVFFDVLEDERYSTTLDRHFKHTTLRLGFTYHGPTELGALVLDPKLRAHGLGRPLSFVRFLFMAMYRSRFRDEVIAELMPPLEPDGRSRLWEHIGRRFTGLPYQEADKLSYTNKEFILSLFPMEMNATLLPDDVRALIGEVGEATKGVRRMLESIGFEYVSRIDPFDGGPHFHAMTDDIAVVKDTTSGFVAAEALDADVEASILFDRQPIDGVDRALLGVGQPEGPPRFRATTAALRRDGDGFLVTKETQQILRVRPGDAIYMSPL